MSTIQEQEPDPAAVTAEICKAFRAFAKRFRAEIGRPMTTEEWVLAELAHSAGTVDGLEIQARLADQAQTTGSEG